MALAALNLRIRSQTQMSQIREKSASCWLGTDIHDWIAQNPNTSLQRQICPTARYRRKGNSAIIFLFCHLLQKPESVACTMGCSEWDVKS